MVSLIIVRAPGQLMVIGLSQTVLQQFIESRETPSWDC